MKNKKMTYLMMLAVLVIWGYFFYTMFGSKDGGDINKMKASIIKLSEDTTQLPIDSFSILAAYRDPFLDKMAEGVKPASSSILKTPPTKKPETAWPQIAYFGLIKNQTSNKQLILMQINGKQHRIQLNQIVDELTLMKITRDSVQVKFGKQMKYVKR